MKIIGYIRVSTQKQGHSGLGLDAQLETIRHYTESVSGEIVQVYKEVESGKHDARPQLAKAIAHAKRINAKLVIAKLDRLARDVYFTAGLIKSGVEFVACDMPSATKVVLHILSAIAEEEADAISKRTKAALDAAKARGLKLGSARPGHWDGKEDRRLAGAAKGSQIAKAKRDAEALPIYSVAVKTAKRMSDEGSSLRAIAEALNSEGLCTARGLPWNPMQVSRLLKSGLCAALALVAASAA